MSKIEVVSVPSSKADEESEFKMQKIVEDRNKVISKRFKMDELDVKVELFYSKGSLVARIDPNGDPMGVFAGYADGSDTLLLVHPLITEGIFKDIYKEMSILVDYCLTKFYLCKKYFPERTDFKMYHRYLSDTLAEISAGNFKPDIAKFDIKMFSEEKKYKREQDLAMIFYIMLEKSGLDYIYEHLDEMMKDLDIRKTVFTIYKKSFNEIVGTYKKELQEIEKQLQLKKGR